MAVKDSIERYMGYLESSYRASQSGDLAAMIQFHFTDPMVGSWVVTITPDACKVERGTTESPTIKVEVDPKIFMDIQEGKIMANMAVSRSKMRLSGDLNLAFRIANAFELPRGLKFALL